MATFTFTSTELQHDPCALSLAADAISGQRKYTLTQVHPDVANCTAPGSSQNQIKTITAAMSLLTLASPIDAQAASYLPH